MRKAARYCYGVALSGDFLLRLEFHDPRLSLVASTRGREECLIVLKAH
jgi:hypothetical protein